MQNRKSIGCKIIIIYELSNRLPPPSIKLKIEIELMQLFHESQQVWREITDGLARWPGAYPAHVFATDHKNMDRYLLIISSTDDNLFRTGKFQNKIALID